MLEKYTKKCRPVEISIKIDQITEALPEHPVFLLLAASALISI